MLFDPAHLVFFDFVQVACTTNAVEGHYVSGNALLVSHFS